ncbi:MAG: DUF1566 domain-containing protein [Thermodesulfobacteriota bacterium]
MDQVRANGHLNIESNFDFDMEIRGHSVTELNFANQVTEDSLLNITAGGSFSVDKKVKIAVPDLPALTIWVGWFPIVIDPQLVVYVGIDGQVSLNMTASVSQDADYIAGLRYSDGAWDPISDFAYSFDYQEPSVTANAGAKAYVSPELNLFLYGVAGPSADLEAYLELDADVFSDPWWQLYAGLGSEVGVQVDIFDKVLLEYSKKLLDYRVLLAQAQQTTQPVLFSSLPDTGQTVCYNNSTSIPCPKPGEPFFGQDANYTINPPAYTDHGNGTVTDNVTGLMWQQGDYGSTNWYKASGTVNSSYNPTGVDVCGDLTLAGYTDWRLPTKKELVGLVDYSRPYPGPTINTTYFPNTKQSTYWSSSTHASYPDYAWYVHFSNGYVGNGNKYLNNYVRCVRDGQ